MADRALFLLDASGHHQLAYDRYQWIVQRRVKSRRREEGYEWRGISFVGLKRDTLISVLRDKGVELTPSAEAKIRSFPKLFEVWLRDHTTSLSAAA